MRLQRRRRELIQTYRTQTKAGALVDPLLNEAVKLALSEGRSLAADSIATIARWIQDQRISAMIEAQRAPASSGTDHSGTDAQRGPESVQEMQERDHGAASGAVDDEVQAAQEQAGADEINQAVQEPTRGTVDAIGGDEVAGGLEVPRNGEKATEGAVKAVKVARKRRKRSGHEVEAPAT